MKLPRPLFLLGAFLCIAALNAAAETPETLPMTEFLARARRANPIATYARLTGRLQHQRRGEKLLTMPIYFGVILHPDRTAGQIVLNEDEGYLLGQSKGDGLTTVTPMNKESADRLGYVGVRASDLTMSFLFCKPEKEFDREMVGGIIPCRVLLLDDPEHKEKIKVWLSAEHAFPLQAEFCRYGETEPFRLLEADGFTKKNDLYFVRKIRLEGPGWRTLILFDADTAEVDRLDPAHPPRNVIIPLKKK